MTPAPVDPPDPATTPTVLFVCTGNLCRSPAAEALFRRSMGDAVHASSAGTRARVGERIPSAMADLITEAGASNPGFTARQLTSELVTRAHLVITMSREHRSAVVQLTPSALNRTFTLLELARLTTTVSRHDLSRSDPALNIARLPALARVQRAHHLGHVDPDDIEDPIGRRAVVYRRSFSAIEAAVSHLTKVVTGHR